MRQQVDIDEMQFGLTSGCGNIQRQLLEKYLQKKPKNQHFASVDLKKAFNRVPRDIVWWTLMKLGGEKWPAKFVQLMNRNARSRVRMDGTFSDDFLV